MGPGFQEARVSQNEIEAEIDDARQQALGQVGTLAPHFDTEKFLASLRLKAAQQQHQQQQQAQQQQQHVAAIGSPTVAYQPQQSYIPQSYPFANDYLSAASQYPMYTPSYSPSYSQSYSPSYAQSYSPSYSPYYYNPYSAYQNQLQAYQNQLLAYQYQQQLAFQQAQYSPYVVSASPLQQSFQQFDYPQRTYYSAAITAPATAAANAAATPAAAYPSYYNYPSYSTPSPYRFFYY